MNTKNGNNKVISFIFILTTILILFSALAMLVIFSDKIFFSKGKDKYSASTLTGESTEIDANSKVDNNDEKLGKTDIISSFNWQQDISSSIGSITFEDQGKVVKMTGNQSNAGKNAIYIIPDISQEQVFSFDYDIDYGDSFIAAGVMLRVKKTDNTLSGYMLSFNNDQSGTSSTSRDYYVAAHNHLGAIWKFTYQLNNNSNNNITKTLVKELNLAKTGNITIDSTSTSIKITSNKNNNGLNEIINVENDANTGEGYGFFTVHYPHSCYQIGHFNLTNFAATIINIIPHKLYVNPNGGTWESKNTTSEVTGVYKDTHHIPLPTRPGYTFVKWDKPGSSEIGTMTSLTDDATYTFGSEEKDETITAQWVKIDITKTSTPAPNSNVTVNNEITYTLTAKNTGTVTGTALFKDTIPAGTTFVPNSITVNGTANNSTQQQLASGITVSNIAPNQSATLTFKVKVNDLENGATIKNKASLTDTTVTSRQSTKDSSEISVKYVEPIISSTKAMTTQNQKAFVVAGERITYTITVKNEGGYAKTVIIKDTIPQGTTFVPNSIKLNGQAVQKTDKSIPTVTDLTNGLSINIPENSTQTITFDVTVNDITDKDKITNKANVDGKDTNTVETVYSEPIISQNKSMTTQHDEDYVINGEKITYKITVKNDGTLGKTVVIKDAIPQGTTFVPNSVKLDGQAVSKTNGSAITESDLTTGFQAEIPALTTKEFTFDVTVNDLDDETKITNTANVDGKDTNAVDTIYSEPIISQSKEMSTENSHDYVITNETITYSIVVTNTGTLGKTVVIKDTVPQGTTFVEGSVKVDGGSEDYSEEDLKNGIKVKIPSRKTSSSGAAKVVVSFKVTANDINDTDEIINKANVDGIDTNEVKTVYYEPIISSSKEIKTEFGKDFVVNGEKITYTIKVKNDGSISKIVPIKDTIPEGTTFVEGSIKHNNEELKKDDNSSYSKDELLSGIDLLIPEHSEQSLSFDVTVNDIDDEKEILNKANVDGTDTNEVKAIYSEPIISQSKEVSAEFNNDYVVKDEKVTYSIKVENSGTLEKNVVVKDTIPEGTTFVEGSIKVNDETTKYTKEELEKGLTLLIPSKKESTSGKSTVVLKFDVTVNDLTDEDTILNTAYVDDVSTNEVSLVYIESVISELKSIKTQYSKDYVAENETITYDITVQNDGSLEKEVLVQDDIPEGTTFVEGSISINGEVNEKYTEEDLKNGIIVLVKGKTKTSGTGTNKPETDNDTEETNKENETESKDNTETENKNEVADLLGEITDDNNSDSESDTPAENPKEDSSDDSTEGKPSRDGIIPGESVLSFTVTVNHLEDDQETVTITNIAKVDGVDTNEVVTEAKPFNFKLDKTIQSVSVNNSDKKISDEKMTKVDIKSKLIKSSKLEVVYCLRVTNTGLIPGSVTVKDTVPKGFSVSSDNSDWTKDENDNLVCTTEVIDPGDYQDLFLVLIWDKSKANFGEKVNTAEIIETQNESNAPEVTLDDNKSEATIIIGLYTGIDFEKAQVLIVFFLPFFILIITNIILIEYKKKKLM